jgi:hypothetical protein
MDPLVNRNTCFFKWLFQEEHSKKETYLWMHTKMFQMNNQLGIVFISFNNTETLLVPFCGIWMTIILHG